jgi:amino acid efflux transporter
LRRPLDQARSTGSNGKDGCDEQTASLEGLVDQELKPSLGLWQGVALYAGSVLGTGVLVLPSIAAETAGPGSLIAWALLVGLSAPMALTYAALCVQRPDSGGFSDSIARAFGPKWGAVAGWLFVAQIPTGTLVAAQIAGQYGASAFGGGDRLAGALGTGLVLAAYALSFGGLRVSASAQLVTLSAIVLGLFAIVVSALPRLSPSAFTPVLPHGTGAVGVAATQLFWAFVGWEAITPLAKEFKRSRDIWRASVLAVIGVGVVYLALAVATVGTHAYGATLASQTPLVFLSRGLFGASSARVVGLGGFLLCFIPLNAYVAGTSRLVYALGKQGHLPRWLGRTSADGVPRVALLTVGAACGVALVVALLTPVRMAELLPYSTASFLATYVLSMAAAVKLLRPPMRVVASVSLVACAGVLCFVGPLLGWIGGITVACLFYQRFVRKGPVGGLAAERSR